MVTIHRVADESPLAADEPNSIRSMLAWLMPLMAVAVALGLYRLGAKALWVDEGLSAAIARKDPLQVLEAAWSTPTPGAMALYYEVLHFWSFLGNSEFVLRSLSVLCTAIAIPVVYSLGVRLADRRAALISAFLVAVSPFVAQYSQEARPYAMVMLLSAASSLALLRAIERPTWRRWMTYAILAIASLYVHNTMAFVLAVQGAWMLIYMPIRDRSLWRPVVAFGAIGFSALPLAGLVFQPTFDWVPNLTLSWLVSVLRTVSGGTDALLIFWLGAVGLGTISAFSRARNGRSERRLIFAVALGLIPVLLEVAISIRRPMLFERYLMVALPGLALAAAIGIAAIPWGRVRWSSLAVFVAFSVAALAPWYTAAPKEGWREAVEVISAEYRTGDMILVYPEYCRLPFDYYMTRDPALSGRAETVFPEPTWGAYFPALNSGPTYSSSLAKLRPGARVWVVTRYVPLSATTPDGKLLWGHLPGYRVLETYRLVGVYVQLLAGP
jgi:mannosyltransferase